MRQPIEFSRHLVATIPIGIAALLLSLLPNAQAQNLVVNGSFENPALPHTEDAVIQPSFIPGWTAINNVLEVGYAPIYVTGGYDGFQVCELDSGTNYTLMQSIAGLSSDSNYILSFVAARRIGHPTDSCTFDVLWNGHLVQFCRPGSDSMSPFQLNLTGVAGTNVLAFAGTGTSDSFGAIIDDVTLTGPQAVVTPEPGSVALALVPLPLAGLILRRRG